MALASLYWSIVLSILGAVSVERPNVILSAVCVCMSCVCVYPSNQELVGSAVCGTLLPHLPEAIQAAQL